MNEKDAWKYSLVRDFFAKYNWSGQESAFTKTTSSDEVLWQLQTVKTFLSQLNWTGGSVKALDYIPSLQGLSNRLAVKDFLHFFIWEGQANIASVPEIPKEFLEELEEDISLNDFSDMF